MPTTLKAAVMKFLQDRSPARGTREYSTTLKKWSQWGKGMPLEELGRQEIREFLDWVYGHAVEARGANPGRTANKAREHLRAIMTWAQEQGVIDSVPPIPKARQQRDVAGRHYLTKPQINALYFATYQMQRPRGWNHPFPIGRYWRSALVPPPSSLDGFCWIVSSSFFPAKGVAS